MDKAERYKDIQKSMLNTFIKKDHDYGSAFDDTCDMFGETAALTRIYDKFNRLKTLAQFESDDSEMQLVNDESMRDTLLDMANYAMLTVLWMDGQKNSGIQAVERVQGPISEATGGSVSDSKEPACNRPKAAPKAVKQRITKSTDKDTSYGRMESKVLAPMARFLVNQEPQDIYRTREWSDYQDGLVTRRKMVTDLFYNRLIEED